MFLGLPALNFLRWRSGSTRRQRIFSKVDLATALAFSQQQRRGDNAEKKRRNPQFARTAQEVLKMAEKVHLSSDDREEVQLNLERLRTELVELGEVFEAVG